MVGCQPRQMDGGGSSGQTAGKPIDIPAFTLVPEFFMSALTAEQEAAGGSSMVFSSFIREKNTKRLFGTPKNRLIFQKRR